MNKDQIKIVIITEGADKANRDINSVQKNVSASTASIAKGVFVANVAFEALKKTISLATDVAKTAVTKTVGFMKDSITAFEDYRRAMTVLGITAQKLGHDQDEATNAARALGKELRLGIGPAADALQVLLKSGLNIEQASDLLVRFTNEAITGKRAGIELGDAVMNLAFGYQSGVSATMQYSGITENMSVITKKGTELINDYKKGLLGNTEATKDIKKQIDKYVVSLKAQGKSLDETSEDQAKYIGMLDLTNLTMGSAEKFYGTYQDNLAGIKTRMNDLKVEIGSRLEPILASVTKVIGEFISKFIDGFMANAPLIDEALKNLKLSFGLLGEALGITKEGTDDFATSLGGTVAKAISDVINFINDMVVAFTENSPAILDALDRFKEAFGIEDGVAGAAGDADTSTNDLATTLGTTLADQLVTAIDTLIDLKTWWDDNKDSIKTFIDAVILLVGWMEPLVSWFVALKDNSVIKFALEFGGALAILDSYIEKLEYLHWLMSGQPMTQEQMQNQYDLVTKPYNTQKQNSRRTYGDSPYGMASGGIIGGNSYSGDRVPIMANSGEMVLNGSQQSALFNLLSNLPRMMNKSVNFNAPVSIGGQRSEAQGMDLFSNYLLKGI